MDRVRCSARQIGLRLKKARGSLRQETLAEATGLSISTIRKIEQGRFLRLDLHTLLSISDALGVETKWFSSTSMPNKLLVRRPISDPDFLALEELERDAYGAEALASGVLRSWVSAYPEGGYALCAGESLVGDCGIWPVTADWAGEFISGVRTEDTLDVRTINRALSSPGGPTCYYFGGILIDPAYRGGIAASYLLRRSMALWVKSFGGVLNPCRVCAMAWSAEGERLLIATGFRLVLGAGEAAHGHAIYQAHLTTERLLHISAEV